ncbi:hypothetical protein [Burkholderia sp. Ac-20365]|jgi:hypothetical protein|uniref:hypothetical protein n=1 Tax=Burkholderia sp. Ac-20365 TaxID=2703897 RepID=UPI00197C46A0|nr:hypothetical protein [Burkholderia sp. Ac-20365]MBN3759422.1 hypothetical protein [Burkholderia sp. Ac-20365]
MEATVNLGKILKVASWYLTCVDDRTTWRHTTAAGLAATWIALMLTIDLPLRNETRQLAAQLAHEGKRHPDRLRAASPPPASSDPRLAFVESLPPFDKCTEQLRELGVLAEQSGVVLASINYRYEPVPGLPVTKVRLGVVARGGAANQRRLLQTTLNAMPNLAVARLVYTKVADGTKLVKLKLDLDMYLQSRAGTTA